MNGYHLPLLKNRLYGRGGGVALYLKNCLSYRRRLDLEMPNLELLWCEVILLKTKILIGVCYRPPTHLTSDMDAFLALLQDSLDAIDRSNFNAVVITGDFNAHFNRNDHHSSTRSGIDLARFLNCNNLFQLIEEPTRITATSETILDLVITDSPGYCTSKFTLSPPANCDHNAIVVKFNLFVFSHRAYKRTIYNFNAVNENILTSSLLSFNWENLFSNVYDIDILYENWLSRFLTIVKDFIPSRVITVRPNDKPWMNSIIRRSIRRRNRLLRKFQKNKLAKDWSLYKTQRNLTVSIIRKEKASYYEKLNAMLSNPKLSAKKWWGVVKSIYGTKVCSTIPPLKENDIYVYDPKEKAKLFNDYFVSQATLDPQRSSPQFVGQFSNSSLSNIAVNPDEVLKLLLRVNISKACGHDGIGNRMIKLCAYGIYSSFTRLINISLSLGQYPKQWKFANVLPIFKKDEHNTKSNYRPVSLLPSLSKICEKIVFVRLYNYLIEIGYLHNLQSGFRPGHSTVLQLTYVVHQIYSSLEEGKEVRGVFLDISKAFDKVWHEGLISKLKFLGIKDTLLKWLESYLSNRFQRVVVEGTNSNWEKVNAGVPQGSVLGPLLFLIYINDITDNIQSEAFLFADDTMILDVVDSPVKSAAKLNTDLASITSWADKWMVTMNPGKTRSMIFSVKKNKPDHPSLLLNQAIIPDVNVHCHLGINLSSDLSWQHHISIISERAAKRLNMLKGLRFRLNRSTLNSMYISFIRPLMEYGDFIWDGCGSECSNALDRIQFDAARLVTGAIKGTNRVSLLEELSWDKLEIRRYIHKLSVLYKIKNRLVPDYLYSVLPMSVSQISNYPLRNSDNICNFSCSTSRFQQSFFPSAIFAWNSLSDSIRNSSSFTNFKNSINGLFCKKKCPKIFEVGARYPSVLHTRLRLGNSTLNDDLFRHNCIPSPACAFGYHRETTEHYLLHCPLWDTYRLSLLTTVAECLGNCWYNSNRTGKLSFLLFGCYSVAFDVNHRLFFAVQRFIIDTSRFSARK